MERVANPFAHIYKAVNSGTNEEKYNRIKRNLNLLPTYLDIELTNNCNFRCIFCPTGISSMQRMRGMMSREVADAITWNVKKYHIQGVRFVRWGEPTLHQDYISIIKNIKQAGALVHMNTNGSLLDEKQMKDLFDIHLDSIKFSFQGADEGTYNEMRDGGDYKRLLNTIRKFYELRENRDYPFIQISTTFTREKKEQIEGFKSDVRDYCDYYNFGYTLLTHLNVNQMMIDDKEKEKIRILQDNESKNNEHFEVCPEAFDKLSINWNGDVTLCCRDYDNYMIVGNILDSDLKEIFHSRAADGYRKVIAKKQYDKIKCCSNCYKTVPLVK